MAKTKTKTVRKQVVGNATLIEKEVFIDGVYDCTYCFAKIGDLKIGGYTSIEDAIAHKCEWYEE